MRILQVHNDYAEPGGETACVDDTVRMLRRAGHEVIEHRRHNREIAGWSLKQKALFPLTTVFSPGSFRALRRLVADERPDVAHLHNTMPLITGAAYYALSASRGPALVQHLHNYRFFCANGLMLAGGRVSEACLHGRYLCTLRERCYRQSRAAGLSYAFALSLHRLAGTANRIDRFIAISEFVKSKYVEHGFPAWKIDVLYQGVEAAATATTPKVNAPVTYLGRLSSEKGVATLLEAVALYNRRLPLRIVGDGPERSALEADAERLRLENVTFTGRLGRNESRASLNDASLLVLPSECPEGYGRTVVEAYAQGVPVLASRIGALPELVREGETGFLFTPGDAADLASQLERVLALPTPRRLELGAAALQAARTRFSPERELRELLGIYENARSAG